MASRAETSETGQRRCYRRPDGQRDPDRSRNPGSGDVLLLVNGFGGTPTLELYFMHNAARRILEKRGLTIARSLRAQSGVRARQDRAQNPCP
jgi:hypothetical protein